MPRLHRRDARRRAGEPEEHLGRSLRLLLRRFLYEKVLPIHERELLTFSILVSQGGCEGQVKAHVGGNATVGNGKEVLLAALTVCLPYIGFPRTLNALSCINEVLPEAKQ